MELTTKLSWLVGILVVLNLILVLFLVWPHLPFAREPGGRDQNLSREADRFMERQIGLSPEQAKQFEENRRNFRRNSDVLRQKIRDNRKQLTTGLFAPDTASEAGRLLDEMAICTRQLEEMSFQHIKGIRDSCNPEQADKLKKLLEELLNQPAPPPRPPDRQ